ncbi:MAG: glycosyltransferase family 39 protein [Thermoanaerobaculia bacterium]
MSSPAKPVAASDGEFDGTSRAGRWNWPDAGLLIVLMTLFLYPWWNTSFGGTLDGYLPFFGHRMLSGEMPYRDFYLHLPPLSVIESAAIDAVAGDRTLIAHRFVGAVERIGLALALYFWLVRRFSRSGALLGAFAAVVAAAGDGTDVLYLYNYQSLFWATIAGWTAAVALDDEGVRVGRWLVSGAATGLCLLTKQTTGVGTLAVLATVLPLLAFHRFGTRGTWLRAASWLGGFALALAPVLLWLARNGALDDALYQVFLDTSTKKGPLGDLLVRAIETTFTTRAFAIPATLAIALCAAAALALQILPDPHAERHAEADAELDPGPPWREALAIALACLAAIPLSRWLHPGLGWLRLPQRVGLYLALFGCAALALHGLLLAARRRLGGAETEDLMFAAVGFATAYMLSLSWAASEAMSVPGLGFFVAIVAHRAMGTSTPATGPASPSTPRWKRQTVVGGVMVLTLAVSWQRRLEPFWFAGWEEPSLDAPRAVSAPRGLSGFSLSQETAKFVERLVADIDGHSRPADRVFVYSAAPVLYLLAEREPRTFASLHWYDVASDEVCRRDLASLLASPPAVLVLWDDSEEEIALYEKVFRAGNESGQREMSRGLRKLATERYVPIETLHAPGGAAVELFALASERGGATGG